MSGFWNDLKHGCRVLLKARGFALSAIIVLALGIGANTAIFGIVNGVLLRPLPFAEPDRLVQLWHTPPQKQFPGVPRFALSAANYLDWQAQNTVFSSSAVYRFWRFRLTGNGEPQMVRARASNQRSFRFSAHGRCSAVRSVRVTTCREASMLRSFHTSCGSPNLAATSRSSGNRSTSMATRIR